MPSFRPNMPHRALLLIEPERQVGVRRATNHGGIHPLRERLHQVGIGVGSRIDEDGMMPRMCLTRSLLTSRSFSSQSTDPGPTPISPHTASNPPLRQPAARWQPSDAYDDPTPPVRVAAQSRVEAGGRQSPAIGSPDKATGSAGKIDPGESASTELRLTASQIGYST